MLGGCCCLWLSRYFCPQGGFGQCIMHMCNAQCGERRPKGRGNFLFKFSCLAVKNEFCFRMINVFLNLSGYFA